ncbi:MAG: DUF983 domain-containing protein [Alphaproteobacteria bacterium]
MIDPTPVFGIPRPVTTPARSRSRSLARGFRRRCPSCGTGSLFAGYLRVRSACSGCGQALEPYRADDGPAYFTVAIVGHAMIFGVLISEQQFTPPLWVQAAIWLPAALIATLALLPRIKGAVIGFQWALDIRPYAGFDREE